MDKMWAIVELFGHSQIAGAISEEEIAGGMFLRVDVPAVIEGQEDFTRYFGAGAIYSITPVAEEIARKAIEALRPKPVTVWGIVGPERQIEVGSGWDSDSDRDEDMDYDQ
jgi:hypothetical protein